MDQLGRSHEVSISDCLCCDHGRRWHRALREVPGRVAPIQSVAAWSAVDGWTFGELLNEAAAARLRSLGRVGSLFGVRGAGDLIGDVSLIDGRPR
jgi:hypothetical protein